MQNDKSVMSRLNDDEKLVIDSIRNLKFGKVTTIIKHSKIAMVESTKQIKTDKD